MPRQKKQRLKQRKDGRYACRYKELWFYGATDDEALAAREEYIRQLSSGQLAPENVLFSDYATRWVQAYKSHLTDGPYNTHVRMCNRFIEHIGNLYVRDIKPTDISSFYQLFAGKSSSSIHSARDTIKGIFRAAHRRHSEADMCSPESLRAASVNVAVLQIKFRAALADGIIDKDPTASVDPPRGTKGTHREITKEERALIHATDHRLRPAVLVMLYAGLRRGEAMALDIDRDVDFKAMSITVREAVRFDQQGRPLIVRPKTAAGVRTVPMLQGLADELRGRHGLLCASADGALMTENAWERAWESYLYALGEKKHGCSRRWAKKPWLPVEIRAHDLRHSYCTMLYDSNVDLKTAMLWMGHADQSMTMNIYTHLTETRRKDAENALRAAQSSAFGSQNGSQKSIPPVNSL